MLEILAGPSAATYVFEAPIEDVNRDLQLLHFRRGALALTEAEAELTAAESLATRAAAARATAPAARGDARPDHPQ